MIRKIKRNLVKQEIGSNKIKSTWREMQIKAWGKLAWAKMFNRCNRKKSSTVKANCENAYQI